MLACVGVGLPAYSPADAPASESAGAQSDAIATPSDAIATPSGKDEAALRARLDNAWSAFEAGDLEAARDRVDGVASGAFSAIPELADECAALGAMIALRMGDAQTAFNALADRPESSRVTRRFRELEAEALATLGRTDAATALLEALVGERASAGAALRLATLRFEIGEHRAALRALEIALEIAPGDYYAEVLRARCRLELGETAAAIRELRALLARADTPEAHYLLGRALEQEQDLAGARRELVRVLDAEPDYLEAVFALARVARASGEIDDARRLFERYRVLQRADWERLRRGTALEQECARRPRDVTIWLEAARFRLETGDPDAAIAAAWHALALDPRADPARLVLARALRAQGRFAEAALHLQKLLRADPTHADADRELRELIERHAKG